VTCVSSVGERLLDRDIAATQDQSMVLTRRLARA